MPHASVHTFLLTWIRINCRSLVHRKLASADVCHSSALACYVHLVPMFRRRLLITGHGQLVTYIIYEKGTIESDVR